MRQLLILGLFLLITPVLFALANSPQFQLAISPELIDLGNVQSSQVLERNFVLQNTGEEGLVIKSITVDCPCTSFQVKDGDKYEAFSSNISITIPPGSSIVFKLVFDSSKTKYIGKFTKYIVISSTDPKWPVKRLKMVGEIFPDKR